MIDPPRNVQAKKSRVGLHLFLSNIPHALVPFQLDKWFDRLTTPRKIEGPNVSSLPCCKGRDRVQRESWHQSLERH